MTPDHDPLDSTVPVTPAVQAYWEAACAARGIDPTTPFQAWYFSNSRESAALLLDLVRRGQKRATASLVLACERAPAGAPLLGGYSVVTTFDGEPGCVIRTTGLRAVPFRDVDAAFAWDEGEGDRTLADWREGHWRFFTGECAELGVPMSEDLLVNCERFELVWPT